MKPPDMKNCSNFRFSTPVLWIGTLSGVNGPVILLEKGDLLHPSLRGTNLVTQLIFPKVSSMIP